MKRALFVVGLALLSAGCAHKLLDCETNLQPINVSLPDSKAESIPSTSATSNEPGVPVRTQVPEAVK